jgi:hypothetical protein
VAAMTAFGERWRRNPREQRYDAEKLEILREHQRRIAETIEILIIIAERAERCGLRR